MMAIFGAILPRFLILVGWTNDPASWGAVFSSPAFFIAGFVVFPWTTLVYALAALNGLSLIDIIFLIFALAIDLGTWGVGFFATKEKYSSYQGA